MTAAEKEYHRLPGTGQRRHGFVSAIAVRSRLWLGKDHLLCVDSMGFSEDYKRFYFRDIQAIIIRKTDRGKIWNIPLLALGVSFTLIAVGMGGVGAAILGTIAGLLLLVLVINVAKGPTSVCHLRTAVQIEELPSLSRLRRAHRVLARLRPHIAAAQGQLAAGEIAARMQEFNQSQPSAAGSAPAPPVSSDDANLPPRFVT